MYLGKVALKNPWVKKCHFMTMVHKYLLSSYAPSTTIGAVSKSYKKKIKEYIYQNRKRFTKSSKKKFKNLVYLKYMNSLAHPGENVGTLASQSIGEPSTQMTLNTFHLAGKGEVNVTLGIPRLRELIMSAGVSNKTPSMILPLKSQYDKEVEQEVANFLKRVTVNDIISEVVVSESIKATGKEIDLLYEATIYFTELD